MAVIVGSAFGEETLGALGLELVEVETDRGRVTLHRARLAGRDAYVLFRHGVPHRWLPNQIPYRAHAAALREVRCGALLVTSSVGVLDHEVALGRPHLVADLVMLDNRLPDGSACTMFDRPSEEQGHLILEEGLFSRPLGEQVVGLARDRGIPLGPPLLFAHVGGPRTKTAAENRLWRSLDAQVNSMTLAPEVVLASELGIPCVGLVVGHKYSLPGGRGPDLRVVETSLAEARDATSTLVEAFLKEARPVEAANSLFRFGGRP